jgi:hypothetical protein
VSHAARRLAQTGDLEPHLPDHLDYLRLRNQRPRSIRERHYAVLRAAVSLGHPVAEVTRDELAAWQRYLGTPPMESATSATSATAAAAQPTLVADVADVALPMEANLGTCAVSGCDQPPRHGCRTCWPHARDELTA